MTSKTAIRPQTENRTTALGKRGVLAKEQRAKAKEKVLKEVAMNAAVTISPVTAQ